VFWSGIVDSGPEWKTASFDVPDSFNGALRVMAVAVAPDAVGVAEKKTLVRAPFVLSPNVPTFAAPGDELAVSVGVANVADGSGPDARITVSLTASKHVELIGRSTETLKVSEGSETVVAFKIRARESLGSASLTFAASSGERSARRTTDLSIRPASPHETTVQ